MDIKINLIKCLIAFVCLGTLRSESIAQTLNLSLKGNVTDETGLTLSAANIYIKELKKTIQTDTTGFYTINEIKPGNYTLHITHIGYEKVVHTISVQQNETFNIVLIRDAKKLLEVTVIGKKTMNHCTASIGKMQIDPLDLPQSVMVINADVLKQQQSLRLSDVVKNVNGVYLSSLRASTREFLNARGYRLNANNMFKNGSNVSCCAMPEMSSLEKIEVLKGSSAVLYGNVSPGAVINMVTKQPKFEQGLEVSLRTGSYDLYKPTFDVYGPINSNIAYRINGTYEQAGSFRDNVSSKRYYINPSMLFKLGAKTEILLHADYLKHQFTPDFGTGAIDNKIVDIPRSAFLGALWSNATTQQTTGSIALSHSLNSAWQLKTILAYQQYERDYFSTECIQPNSKGEWSRPLGKNNQKDNDYNAQINLTGKFKTGQVAHSLLIGTDANRLVSSIFNYKSVTYDQVNILNANKQTRTDVPIMDPATAADTPTNRYGLYVNDLISVTEKIKVLAGLRWSYQTSVATTTDLESNIVAVKEQTDKAFSPRLGVVCKLTHNNSLFASYSNSFHVNKGQDIYDNPLKPSLIDQYELGVKNDFLKGLLSANITLYRIVNSNLAQTAQFDKDGKLNNNVNLKALVGETTSDGIEIDLSSHPLPGLSILAGYSHNDMRFTKTPGTVSSYYVGDRVVGTPAYTANASVFYEFGAKKLKGLQVGVSANYIGARIAGWNRTVGESKKIPLAVSDFATVDLSVGYTFKKVSLQTKLSNVGNELNYYVHENYSVNPIPPRQVLATLSYKL